MSAPLQPRLIRPERDGQVGEWSYLFKVNGEEFIFPALVNELGKLRELVEVSSKEQDPVPDDAAEPGDPRFATKIIYWKASEWETKLLPPAVEWIKRYGWKMPDIPYYHVELRKIEDRDGEERVTEVMNLTGVPDGEEQWEEAVILAYQFTDVGGEEGKSQKPLLQWWSQSVIRFSRREIQATGFSVMNLCNVLRKWADVPLGLRSLIEERGTDHMFRIMSVHGSRKGGVTDEELRSATMFIAFCLHINSMKVRYVDGPEPSTPRPKSAPRTLEEAVALEQAVVLKSAGILKSGVRRRKVLNPGSGTKHRYRYLVRGHERVINGKSIWVKPQIRGQGEFMVLPTATSEEVQKVVPETPVTVSVPVGTRTEPVAEPPKMLLLPAPKPVRPEPRRGLLATLRKLLASLFPIRR